MISGAVSPIAWASPMMVPVRMPGSDNGSTWSRTTCQRVHPIASAPRRMGSGTARSAARVLMMMIGSVIKPMVRPPASADDRGTWKKLMNTASPSRPKRMDGTAARLLMFTSMVWVRRLSGANSSRYTAVITPMGNANRNVSASR